MKYAIVESGGKQYKAVEGATIEVDRLSSEPGASIKIEQVLLLADGEKVTVGTPLVKGTPVWTRVIEHFKGPKVVIFNYRPKKRIRVKTGHRQNYTRLFVEQIGGAALAPRQEPVKAIELEEAPAKAEKPTKPAEKPAQREPKEPKPVQAEKKATRAAPKKPAASEKKPAKAAPARTADRKTTARKTGTKKSTGKSSTK